MELLRTGGGWPSTIKLHLQVVLKDSYFKKSEAEMEDFDGAGTWLKHHWAPFWSG